MLQLITDVVDAVAVADRGVREAARVDVVADRGDQAMVASMRDVGRALDLVPGEHGGPLHERRDSLVRDRGECFRQRVLAYPRRESARAAARDGDLRPTVDPGARQLVARI